LCEGCESKNIEIPVTRARGILVENLCTKFWGKRVGKQKRSNRIFCCFLISVWSWRGLNPRPNGEPTSFLHA